MEEEIIVEFRHDKPYMPASNNAEMYIIQTVNSNIKKKDRDCTIKYRPIAMGVEAKIITKDINKIQSIISRQIKRISKKYNSSCQILKN